MTGNINTIADSGQEVMTLIEQSEDKNVQNFYNVYLGAAAFIVRAENELYALSKASQEAHNLTRSGGVDTFDGFPLVVSASTKDNAYYRAIDGEHRPEASLTGLYQVPSDLLPPKMPQKAMPVDLGMSRLDGVDWESYRFRSVPKQINL